MQRRKVAAAAAGGMSHDAIALALGITRPTLVKYFDAELTTGAAQKRMEALDALFAAAKKGNVSAIKTVLLVSGAVEPPTAPGAGASTEGEKPEATPAPSSRLGKKEAQQIAARSAQDGTEWADLLPPAGRVQ
ncbi:MAG: hypothetical protein EKK53_15300 [Burkholderiales bacterium]|nr:MAG: hypothetical protein EKK53_15300 [Burkholderiales bacterium]